MTGARIVHRSSTTSRPSTARSGWRRCASAEARDGDDRRAAALMTVLDEATLAEARSFNEALAEVLASSLRCTPSRPSAPGRAPRGRSVWPQPVFLSQARDLSVRTRSGTIRVRVLAPEKATACTPIHGGGWCSGAATSRTTCSGPSSKPPASARSASTTAWRLSIPTRPGRTTARTRRLAARPWPDRARRADRQRSAASRRERISP